MVALQGGISLAFPCRYILKNNLDCLPFVLFSFQQRVVLFAFT